MRRNCFVVSGDIISRDIHPEAHLLTNMRCVTIMQHCIFIRTWQLQSWFWRQRRLEIWLANTQLEFRKRTVKSKKTVLIKWISICSWLNVVRSRNVNIHTPHSVHSSIRFYTLRICLQRVCAAACKRIIIINRHETDVSSQFFLLFSKSKLSLLFVFRLPLLRRWRA